MGTVLSWGSGRADRADPTWGGVGFGGGKGAEAAGLTRAPPQGRRQSTGVAPISVRIVLARLKGREPKNPREADSGDG